MGSVFKPKYWVKRDDGTREERVATAWYVRYTNAHHRQITKKAGITREQAVDVLRKLEMDVLYEKHGMPTSTPATILLNELASQYIAYQRPRVRAGYCRQLESCIGYMFRKTGSVYLRDLSPLKVEQVIWTLADSARAPSTVNGYLKAIKAMLRWAVKRRLVPYNQLECVSNLPEIERKHRRRALSEEEISQLLAAAVGGPVRRYMRQLQNRPRKDGTYKPKTISLTRQEELLDDGKNNVLAYRLMIEIGLRKNEAASVTWRDVDLDGGTIIVRSHWKGNKNHKETMLPLTPGLRRTLASWRHGHFLSEDSHVVHISDRLLRCFNDDLVEAQIARRVPVDSKGTEIPIDSNGRPTMRPAQWKIVKRDGAGFVVDLHALRHTFGTRLGRMPGIDVKSIQALMRHSDLKLTFGVYVHSDVSRLRSAVAILPEIGIPGECPTIAAATTPDDYLPTSAI